MTTNTTATALVEHARDTNIDGCAYFHGFLSREDVDTLLPNKGDFLLRKSETAAGKWNYVLSLRCHDDNKVSPYPSPPNPNACTHFQTLRHYVLHRENKVYSFRNNRSYKDAIVMIDAHRNARWPLDSLVPTAVLTRPITKQSWEVRPHLHPLINQ